MSTTITPAPSFELETYKPLDNTELDRRVAAVKQQLGNDLLILGHHYQQDEVIADPGHPDIGLVAGGALYLQLRVGVYRGLDLGLVGPRVAGGAEAQKHVVFAPRRPGVGRDIPRCADHDPGEGVLARGRACVGAVRHPDPRGDDKVSRDLLEREHTPPVLIPGAGVGHHRHPAGL